MSYDLLVFTSSEPTSVRCRRRRRVEVERPERVEIDDVPRVAVAAMLAPS